MRSLTINVVGIKIATIDSQSESGVSSTIHTERNDERRCGVFNHRRRCKRAIQLPTICIFTTTKKRSDSLTTLFQGRQSCGAQDTTFMVIYLFFYYEKKTQLHEGRSQLTSLRRRWTITVVFNVASSSSMTRHCKVSHRITNRQITQTKNISCRAKRSWPSNLDSYRCWAARCLSKPSRRDFFASFSLSTADVGCEIINSYTHNGVWRTNGLFCLWIEWLRDTMHTVLVTHILFSLHDSRDLPQQAEKRVQE